MADADLEVHLDLGVVLARVGTAFFVRRNNVVSTTFAYSSEYIARPGAFAIDPHLPLMSGNQRTEGSLPGSFQDCSPDRWGRNLITKRRHAESRRIAQTPPSMSDIDFLVGVSDLTRQGALRFRPVGTETFVDPESRIPKLIALPRLLDAVDRVAGDDMAAIRDLLDAGSGSLGGARPKASVLHPDGHLLLAKFPHSNDDWDVMAWEKTALDLAESAGIPVPGRRLDVVGGRNVLLLDRFDRTAGGRVPYISAMTLVAGRDGDQGDYATIAEYLPEYGGSVVEDLAAIYRRAVFSVAIHNTDDHLRNHGLLRTSKGWSLSPAFDMNPNPNPGAARMTAIAGATRPDEEAEGLELLAQECRVTQQSPEIMSEVLAAVGTWRSVAAANGISISEQNRFADAIEGRLSLLRTLVMPAAPSLGKAASRISGPQPREPKGSTNGPGRFVARGRSVSDVDLD